MSEVHEYGASGFEPILKLPVAEIAESDHSLTKAFEVGLDCLKAGRIQRSEAILKGILDVDPDHADSLHLLGIIAQKNGRMNLAIDYFDRAIGLRPLDPGYHNSLANALWNLGRIEDAVSRYRTALRLKPDSPEINNNLANVLRSRGRVEEAATHYRMALELKPDSPDIHYNLANVLWDLEYRQEAQKFYREAIRLKPDFADAHYNLGNALMVLCHFEEAETAYRKALLHRPDFPDALNNLGNALQELNRIDEAVICYRASVDLAPRHLMAHYNLACALSTQNRPDEAAKHHATALAIKPGYGPARIGLCMAQLPILYMDEAEIGIRRSAYERCLRRLAADVVRQCPDGDLVGGCGTNQPFFLAYQGHNDREIQAIYGSMLSGIMATEHPPAPLAPPPGSGGKIRMGIVSGFFQQHTVWRLLIKGWLTQLDRGRFEIFGYHTGAGHDSQTDMAAALCDRFVEGHLPCGRLRELILADAPHILIYPETGMDPTSAQLAAQRLAPVQCCSWGHPDTSGLPTIDYFLSSDLMEPPDGQAHYTEHLVRLPNLATFFEPDDRVPVPAGRADFGFRSTAVVYWSGQALYKYLPQDDHVFPRIAREVGDCQFVFIEYGKSRHVTNLFRERLSRAFSSFGLKARDYCVFLPPLDRSRFIAAVGEIDIVLDTIGWSGGLSTLDCLAHNPPIVTMEGPLMRGRHTAAILRRIGATETIANGIHDYLSIVVQLAEDGNRRRAIRRKICLNKYRVYRDETYIYALEEFMERAVRKEELTGGKERWEDGKTGRLEEGGVWEDQREKEYSGSKKRLD